MTCGVLTSSRFFSSRMVEAASCAVAALPGDQRRVVEMRFFGDASLQDIAAALDCPEGTVKSRLHHALRTLREKRMNLSGLAGESGVNP